MAMSAKKRVPQPDVVATPATAKLQVASGAPAGVSVVGDMQASLQQRLNETPGKWSRRRTVAFVLTTCGSFWAMVLVAVLR